MSNQSGIALVDTQDLLNKIDETIDRRFKDFEEKLKARGSIYNVNGMTEKPLHTSDEVREMFQISRQTLHNWVKNGKLPKRKVNERGKAYFLYADIEKLIQNSTL